MKRDRGELRTRKMSDVSRSSEQKKILLGLLWVDYIKKVGNCE